MHSLKTNEWLEGPKMMGLGKGNSFQKLHFLVSMLDFWGVFTILFTKILQVIPFFDFWLHPGMTWRFSSYQPLVLSIWHDILWHICSLCLFRMWRSTKKTLVPRSHLKENSAAPWRWGGAELPCSFWHVYLLEMMKSQGSRKLGKLVGRPCFPGFLQVWQIPEMSGTTFVGQIGGQPKGRHPGKLRWQWKTQPWMKMYWKLRWFSSVIIMLVYWRVSG